MNSLDQNNSSDWPVCVINHAGEVLWHDQACKADLVKMDLWRNSAARPKLSPAWVKSLWSSVDRSKDHALLMIKSPAGDGFGFASWTCENPDELGLTFWPDDSPEPRIDPLWGRIFEQVIDGSMSRGNTTPQRRAA